MSVINVDGMDDLSPLAFASGLRFLNIDGYVGMTDRKPPLDLTGIEVWADSLSSCWLPGATGWISGRCGRSPSSRNSMSVRPG
jgi:hypothetical protein